MDKEGIKMSQREVKENVKRAIQKNYCMIIHGMDPLPIIRHLREYEVFGKTSYETYYEELNNMITKRHDTKANVNDRLLEILYTRERWWIPFIKVLRFYGNNGIADIIEDALPETEKMKLRPKRHRSGRERRYESSKQTVLYSRHQSSSETCNPDSYQSSLDPADEQGNTLESFSQEQRDDDSSSFSPPPPRCMARNSQHYDDCSNMKDNLGAPPEESEDPLPETLPRVSSGGETNHQAEGCESDIIRNLNGLDKPEPKSKDFRYSLKEANDEGYREVGPQDTPHQKNDVTTSTGHHVGIQERAVNSTDLPKFESILTSNPVSETVTSRETSLKNIPNVVPSTIGSITSAEETGTKETVLKRQTENEKYSDVGSDQLFGDGKRVKDEIYVYNSRGSTDEQSQANGCGRPVKDTTETLYGGILSISEASENPSVHERLLEEALTSQANKTNGSSGQSSSTPAMTTDGEDDAREDTAAEGDGSPASPQEEAELEADTADPGNITVNRKSERRLSLTKSGELSSVVGEAYLESHQDDTDVNSRETGSQKSNRSLSAYIMRSLKFLAETIDVNKLSEWPSYK